MADEYGLDSQENDLNDEYESKKVERTAPFGIDVSAIPEYQVFAKGKQDAEAQLAKLQEALARRLEMPFNPVLMKMAAGFLAPTKGGSFGESLGYAASAGAEEAEKERGRKVDVEKLQLELVKQQEAMKRKNAALAILGGGAKGMTGVPGGAQAPSPAGQPTPAGAPTEGAAPVSTPQLAQMVAKDPSILDKITVTPQLIQALALIGDKDVLNMAVAMQKSQMSMANLELQERKTKQGEFDMVEVPNPFDPTAPKGIQIPRSKVAEYNRVAATNDEQQMYKFLAQAGVPGYFGKVPTTEPTAEQAPTEGGVTKPVVPPPPKFVPPLPTSQREIEEAGSKAKAQKRGEESVKQEVSLLDANKNAVPVMQSAENIKSLAASNPRVFNLMQGTDFTDALSRTISQGINTPWGSIGIDMRPLNEYAKKLDAKDRSAFMMAAQNFAVLQLLASKLQQGQGAVSDYERSLFGELSIGKGDNATTMRLKAEALAERAKFDQQAYSAYRRFLKSNKNASYEDFVDTESGSEYSKLLEQYNNKIQRMRNANAQLLGGVNPSQKNPQSGGSLYNRLLEETPR